MGFGQPPTCRLLDLILGPLVGTCRAAIDPGQSPFVDVQRASERPQQLAAPQPLIPSNPTSYQIMARHAAAREAVRRRMQASIEAARAQGVPAHTLWGSAAYVLGANY